LAVANSIDHRNQNGMRRAADEMEIARFTLAGQNEPGDAVLE
jgi:hypothetical protein